MADQTPPTPPSPIDQPPAPPTTPGFLVRFRHVLGDGFALRKEIPFWQALLLGVLCLLCVLTLWWYVTRGESDEERILPRSKGLYSPKETYDSFSDLLFERNLDVNTLITLRRLVLGFGLATVIGVPVGVLCGCFPRYNAFLLPVTIFGRNIPIAALVPLMYALFGIEEKQKVIFIFVATVAFVISDTARGIMEVGSHYVDTAFTLGASRLQVVLKVLVPLALPGVFNSLRLLFGLAFGYIMLAETITVGGEEGGLGHLINVSFKRGPREHILAILLIIPVIALGFDRILFWIQRELFPYRYGGSGLLLRLLRGLAHTWEDIKAIVRPRPVPEYLTAPLTQGSGGKKG